MNKLDPCEFINIYYSVFTSQDIEYEFRLKNNKKKGYDTPLYFRGHKFQTVIWPRPDTVRFRYTQ